MPKLSNLVRPELSGAWIALFLLGVTFCPWWAKNSHGKERVESERSHRSRPEWVTRAPQADKEYLYFVGRSSGAPSLEAAETDAAAEAVRQIVTMIGVEGSFSYDRLRREAGLLLEDRLALSGSAPIVGLKRIETYFEKSTVSGPDSQRVRYDSHLLVRYPLGALNSARQNLELETRERVHKAESLLSTGRELEVSGEPGQAFESYCGALELIEDSPAAFGAEPGRLAALSHDLSAAVFRAGLASRMLVLETPAGDERPAWGTSAQEVVSALLAEGFTPSENSSSPASKALPRLRTECSQADSVRLEDGFWLSLWNASFRLLDPLSGEVVLAADYTTKGFGSDLERAGLDARRKMRIEIFPRFAREARLRLESQAGVADAPVEKILFTR